MLAAARFLFGICDLTAEESNYSFQALSAPFKIQYSISLSTKSFLLAFILISSQVATLKQGPSGRKRSVSGVLVPSLILARHFSLMPLA